MRRRPFNTRHLFAGRWEQLPQNVEEGQRLFGKHLKHLDQMLKERTWLTGDQFSVADITAICAIDFGKVSGCRANPELEHINNGWEIFVSDRVVRFGRVEKMRDAGRNTRLQKQRNTMIKFV